MAPIQYPIFLTGRYSQLISEQFFVLPDALHCHSIAVYAQTTVSLGLSTPPRILKRHDA